MVASIILLAMVTERNPESKKDPARKSGGTVVGSLAQSMPPQPLVPIQTGGCHRVFRTDIGITVTAFVTRVVKDGLDQQTRKKPVARSKKKGEQRFPITRPTVGRKAILAPGLATLALGLLPPLSDTGVMP